jgi:hypothetical protein
MPTSSCPSYPNGNAGSLGFRGTSCCRAPCPAIPLDHVVICFEVNACTSVAIEVSCPTNCVLPTEGDGGTTDPSSTHYPSGWQGVSEDSWGRAKRVVKFDQMVQRGSYIRIVTCKNPGVCSCVNCGLGPETTGDVAYPEANKLFKFDVNREGIVDLLEATLNATTHRNGCVYVGFQDRNINSQDIGCASYTVDGFDSLTQIPQGAEILVGPIGARAF